MSNTNDRPLQNPIFDKTSSLNPSRPLSDFQKAYVGQTPAPAPQK